MTTWRHQRQHNFANFTENIFTICCLINLALTRLTRVRLESSSCLPSDIAYFPMINLTLTRELRGMYSLKFPSSRNLLPPGYTPRVVGVRLPGGRLPLAMEHHPWSIIHGCLWLHHPWSIFPLDVPPLGSMASKRVGSPSHLCQYLCQYFLPASLL